MTLGNPTESSPTPFSLTETGIYRIIVQQGSMINNDDCFYYWHEEVNHDTFKSSLPKRLKGIPWTQWSLVVCRPVLEGELDSGLNVEYIGRCYPLGDEARARLDAVVPEVSRFLDEVFKIRNRLQEFETDLVRTLLHDISYAAYDCMSGGVSNFWSFLMSSLVLYFEMDLNEPVYPAPEDVEDYQNISDDHLVEVDSPASKWFTLKHFVDWTASMDIRLPPQLELGSLTPLMLPRGKQDQ